MQVVPTLKRSGIDTTRDTKPWYKQRWPWYIMLGPAVVVVASSYSAYLAVTRADALVVDDYYTQGNAINRDLRRDRAATKLALALDVSYDPAASKLRGTLLSAGKPLAATKVNIHMAHATQPEKDLKFMAETDQNGQFSLTLPDLEMARWEVAVASADGEWRLAANWKWPAQKSVVIRADLPTTP